MSYPYPSLSFDPYASQGTGDPYAPDKSPGQGMPFPEAMPDDGDDGDVPYPLDQMDGSPYAMSADGYARGGRVEENGAPLASLADRIQGEGRHGDTLLAHINPVEAMILKSLGGSGTLNPRTGLPEYFNLGRFLKKIVGPGLGAVLGNMILPGAGALIGGGIGGMFGHPNQRMGPLAGAGVGAFAPMAMGGLGNLIAGAGMQGAGGMLNALAGQTANPLTSFLMPGMVSGGGTATSPFALSSLINGGSAAASTPFSLNPVSQLSSTLAAKGAASSPGFLASLMGGAAGGQGGGMGGYMGQLLQPQNLIPLASLGHTMATHVSPEKQFQAQYRAQAEGQKYLDDMLHAPDRMRQQAKLERELEREKWEPLAQSEADFETEQVSPEEYERSGKWFRKYKKDKQGQRVEVPYASGGEVTGYLGGSTGGQDDKIPAWLSDGEYIMDANTVSAVGDGNNAAGAQRLDAFRKKLLKHKGMKGFPPKTKPLEKYLH